jgi:hypothetical protein
VRVAPAEAPLDEGVIRGLPHPDPHDRIVRHRTTRRPLRLFDNAPLAEESHSSAILILGYVKLKQQKGKT